MSDTASTSEPAIEPRHFRETLGHYPTGVAVVTAVTEENGPVGMVVGSFTSVSLDPPLVAFMPQKTSGTFELLRTATSFCVNVLSADQERLCRRFATSGADKFDGVTWEPAPSGAPVLSDVVAWIDCSYESIVEAGDHYIVVGGSSPSRRVTWTTRCSSSGVATRPPRSRPTRPESSQHGSSGLAAAPDRAGHGDEGAGPARVRSACAAGWRPCPRCWRDGRWWRWGWCSCG